jgi:DVNP family
MTRFTKTASGRYMVQGKSYEMLVGSRAQVWHGTAYKTSGGLCKTDLMQNKSGRIVSKDKHNTAKREKRLLKAGYGTKKGKFGFVLLGKSRKHHGRKSRSQRRHKGGNGVNYPLSPTGYDGRGVGTSGVDLQFVAGNAA